MTTYHQRLALRKKLWLALLIGLLAGAVFAQMPPTNTARVFTGPRQARPVATNVVFSWDVYTNVWIEITTATNLAATNWVSYTNLPIGSTQFCAPIAFPQQFFRQRVIIYDTFTTN